MSISPEPQVLTVEEAGRALGISRWLAYEMARTGSIAGVPVIRIGRRYVVPRPALERVLRGEVLPCYDGGQDAGA
ncbi:MAG: helix-turn-helix domain-containing protein [Sphaerobacter sp.]|nr:helix-turn-helix domain-containing protein [Sphaerobacter sp.]